MVGLMIYIQCQQNDSHTETPAIQRSSSAPKALSPTVIRIFRKHVNFNQTGAGIFATVKMKGKQAVNDRKICVHRRAQKRAIKDSFCKIMELFGVIQMRIIITNPQKWRKAVCSFVAVFKRKKFTCTENCRCQHCKQIKMPSNMIRIELSVEVEALKQFELSFEV